MLGQADHLVTVQIRFRVSAMKQSQDEMALVLNELYCLGGRFSWDWICRESAEYPKFKKKRFRFFVVAHHQVFHRSIIKFFDHLSLFFASATIDALTAV